MKTGTIQSKLVAKDRTRLDSKFHLSDGLITVRKINKSHYPIQTLNQVTTHIFNGPRFKRVYVKDTHKGVPFMGSSDMLRMHLDSLKLISKKYSKNIDSLKLKENWILVSCSGTIGNTIYTNKEFIDKTASQHIMRIIPNNQKIREGFLYAYLSSKYGYALLTQGTYGAVIQHIEPEHIENIPVPIFPKSKQKEIHNLIIESANLRVEANQLLYEAITLFEKYIGKNTFSFKYQTKALRINKRNTYSKRLDAQFAITHEEIRKEKKDLEYIPISTLASYIFVGNRAKRIYVQDGIPFLSSSDMMLFNPIRYAKQISKKSSHLSSLQVGKGDILISRSGTIGNTVLVGEVLTNIAVSEHALRLVIDKNQIAPEYVYCYLNTRQGKRLMEGSAYGSVIITLNEDYVGNILLPILNDEVKTEIIEKIRTHSNKVDEAILKENQAIALVEKEIESWQ